MPVRTTHRILLKQLEHPASPPKSHLLSPKTTHHFATHCDYVFCMILKKAVIILLNSCQRLLFVMRMEVFLCDVRKKIFKHLLHYPVPSRPVLGPTQPPSKLVPMFFRGINRPGRQADQSPLSSAKVKHECTPYVLSWRGQG
jgi:hypothetical protein